MHSMFSSENVGQQMYI